MRGGGNTWQRPGFCLIRQNRPPVATRALPKSASSGSQMPFLTSSGTFAHCQPIWTKSQHTLYLRKAKIGLQRQQKKCHRRSILARVFAIGGRFWLFDATGGRFWQGSGHRTRAIKGRFCLMGMSSLKKGRLRGYTPSQQDGRPFPPLPSGKLWKSCSPSSKLRRGARRLPVILMRPGRYGGYF